MSKKLKVLDLFAGTRSIGKAFEERGHEVYSIEWDEKFEGIDWYVDIFEVTAEDILERFGQPDVIWASPPCEKFSVAAIGKHWHKGTNKPKTPETKRALELLEHTIKLIEDLSPKYFFIENPRGKMRKVDPVQHLPRYTVTYCQYYNRDDYPDLTDEEAENMRRMKPTDIWTNHPNPKFKPACKNGDPCHVSAPRGARTGTQGLRTALQRSRIPHQLCLHVAKISEE